MSHSVWRALAAGAFACDLAAAPPNFPPDIQGAHRHESHIARGAHATERQGFLSNTTVLLQTGQRDRTETPAEPMGCSTWGRSRPSRGKWATCGSTWKAMTPHRTVRRTPRLVCCKSRAVTPACTAGHGAQVGGTRHPGRGGTASRSGHGVRVGAQRPGWGTASRLGHGAQVGAWRPGRT